MPRRVTILGGGTAGHVYPPLAIATAYGQRVPDAEILFLGTARGYEKTIVPAAGCALEMIPGRPWQRVGVAGKLGALVSVVTGMAAARRILRRTATDLVIGFGGYASAGALLAARSLRVPIVLHEANVRPGLTNRLFARLAERIYVTFEAARGAFPVSRTILTGIPIRSEIFAAAEVKQPPARAETVRILVTGGSMGVPFLNRRAPGLLAQIACHGSALDVLHQVGVSDAAAVEGAYRRAGIRARVVPFIDDMPSAYRWAHFAITGAGAVTLLELAAAGVPCLVVPLASASEDHQSANAYAFAASTGALAAREINWDEVELAAQIAAILQDSQRWQDAAQRMRCLARPDAAAAIVADCEALLSAR